MKKFLYVLFNTVFFTIGMLLFTNSDAIRQFICNFDYSNTLATLACGTTIAISCTGLLVMVIGIHGVIYQLTGFSLYNYACKKLLTTEKTDN